MTTVRVYCDTGKTWVTRINADINAARDYFMGEVFVDETDDGIEIVNLVVLVDEV